MSDREELEALRRLAELEAKSGGSPKVKEDGSLSGWMAKNRARNAELTKNGWGTGFGPAMYELGGKVTDITGSPELGAATNFITNAIPAALTSGRLADVPATSLLQKPAEKVMQSAVKPALADRASGDAGRAINTMLRENIYPTPGGMDKAGQIIGKLNTQVENAVAASPASVKVGDVTARLADPMKKFGMQVNPQADTAAVENVWTNFLTNPHVAGKAEIPVQLAHQLKKGTYASLGGKSYGEVGSASTEAQKALARGLREEVAGAVPAIVEPLKREASLMNVRDVAMNRALQNANKDLLGLAGLRLDHPLSAGMTMADRINAIKAFLAMQMYGAGNPQVLAPLGTSAGILANQPQGVLYQQ